MAKVKITTPQNAKQIAQQYGTTAKQIRELNKLDKGEKISGTVRLGKGVGPVTPSRTAESLYVDPTPMFQPAMDFINQQMGQANTRYAANQADIKSIFGNLTTVRAEDKAKIKKQFEDSITNQQLSLAQRTAEARSGSEAGAQQLAVTAGERGEGPMPASTPVQQAAEEGIARSNEYQQTWEALQNVMSQQAQNDVQSAISGYDFQQASALEQLRNNLEDRLAGLEGQRVDVQSQLAGAQLQGRQGVMQANYGEIQNRRAQEAALREAQARAGGRNEPRVSSNQFSEVLNQNLKGMGVNKANRDAFFFTLEEVEREQPRDSVQAYNSWLAKNGDNSEAPASARLRRAARDYFDNMYSRPSINEPRGTTGNSGTGMLPGLQPVTPGQ
jgi:hypothetical protein